MGEPGATRAAIYCRISKDDQLRGVGVEQQERDGRSVADRIGATVTHVLTDNDLSASRYARKKRPAYLQLLDLIRAQHIDVVIAQHPDRLVRQPRELEDLVTLVDQHHVGIETARAGVVDLSSAAGRLNARNIGNFSAYSSEVSSERIRGHLHYRAMDGHPHGVSAYGWTRGRDLRGNPMDILNPDEAAVIRRIVQAVLDGESLRAFAKQLNEAGVPTHRGGPWTPAHLRHFVRRPRNAGLRVHRGKIIGDGTWAPILERETWERACAVLDNPARTTTPGPEPKHLLTGIALCGICDGRLTSATINGRPSYRCATKFCVVRHRPDVEAWVVENMLAFLLDPSAARILAPARPDTTAAAKEAPTLRARLDHAASQWAAGVIDERQLAVISAKLRPQLAALESLLAVDRAPDTFQGLLDYDDHDALAEAWGALSIARRRAAVRAAFVITVHRTMGGRRPFDPSAVTVVPRRHPA